MFNIYIKLGDRYQLPTEHDIIQYKVAHQETTLNLNLGIIYHKSSKMLFHKSQYGLKHMYMIRILAWVKLNPTLPA